MKITQDILDTLSEKATQNPRLRISMDLRTNAHDLSQRMLNALEPGTMIPIHRHQSTAETLTVIRGRVKELFYNDEGCLTDSFEMTANGECPVLQIEKGQWHSLECLESGTVIFEAKDGMYTPLADTDIMTINTTSNQ